MANELAKGGTGATANHPYYANPPGYGNYQFITLSDIIDNFMATYVGEEKILPRTNRTDVSFHAHRALQELSFDTLKSCKSYEITLPPSLQMRLPNDYVNYTKMTWSDASGIEHVIYPTSKTSNPQTIQQDDEGEYLFVGKEAVCFTRGDESGETFREWLLAEDHIEVEVGDIDPDVDIAANSTGPFKVYTFGEGYIAAYGPGVYPATAAKSPLQVGMEVHSKWFPPGTTIATITHTVGTANTFGTYNGGYTEFTTTNATLDDDDFPMNHITMIFNDNTDDTTWGKYKSATPSENQDDYQDDTYWPVGGERYGLDPQHAQANGSFFIDCHSGTIHFSSNLSGKTIILHYLSDHHGTDDEQIVHKFAEEAMYKWIVYGCISARMDVPEYVINRFKKERFAETRKAKLRLSNIKLEEITQILRGKSKQIKH